MVVMISNSVVELCPRGGKQLRIDYNSMAIILYMDNIAD